MHKLLTFIKQNPFIFFLSVFLFVFPLIISYVFFERAYPATDLNKFFYYLFVSTPKGFEVTKVLFFQIFSLLLILLAGFLVIKNAVNKETLKMSGRYIGLFALVLTIFILPTVFSIDFQTAIWGNEWRFQGLLTHILIIAVGFLTYAFVTRKNVNFIKYSLIFAGIIQALIGLNQCLYYLRFDPNKLSEGLWINGSFGQANFYSGFLLVAFFLTLSTLTNKLRIRVILKYLLLAFLAFSIIISFSYWGIITLVFGIVLFALGFLFKQKPAKKLVVAYLITALLAFLGFIAYYFLFLGNVDFRIEIYKSIIQVFGNLGLINPNFWFGFGFDTLGQVLNSYGFFPNMLVDRAHNIFLDVLSQTGAIGLLLFSMLITYLVFCFIKLPRQKNFYVYFFIFIISIFRSFVHESGIVNLVVLTVFGAIALKSRKTTFDL